MTNVPLGMTTSWMTRDSLASRGTERAREVSGMFGKEETSQILGTYREGRNEELL
jgi:hypothetical protein